MLLQLHLHAFVRYCCVLIFEIWHTDKILSKTQFCKISMYVVGDGRIVTIPGMYNLWSMFYANFNFIITTTVTNKIRFVCSNNRSKHTIPMTVTNLIVPNLRFLFAGIRNFKLHILHQSLLLERFYREIVDSKD